MISYLHGTIHELGEHSLILLVSGVGYEVFVPAKTLQSLTKGNEATFHIHHHIREDNQQLFGFVEKPEKELFRQMIHHVSGVGPKIAMAAMGAANHADLVRAIQLEDTSIFKGIPGVGPKTAKRIVMELKSKVSWEDLPAGAAGGGATVRSDLLLAMEQLGYQSREVQELLADIDVSEMKLEDALKQVLQKMKQ